MKRSALPLVLGVYGLVRMCLRESRLQALAKARRCLSQGRRRLLRQARCARRARDERGRLPLLFPQLAGLRAVTIHVALSIITDRSPGRPAKAARTAAEARARMSSG